MRLARVRPLKGTRIEEGQRGSDSGEGREVLPLQSTRGSSVYSQIQICRVTAALTMVPLAARPEAAVLLTHGSVSPQMRVHSRIRVGGGLPRDSRLVSKDEPRWLVKYSHVRGEGAIVAAGPLHTYRVGGLIPKVRPLQVDKTYVGPHERCAPQAAILNFLRNPTVSSKETTSALRGLMAKPCETRMRLAPSPIRLCGLLLSASARLERILISTL